jgi:hypothetical protein
MTAATPDLVYHVAANARRADVDEITSALGYYNPAQLAALACAPGGIAYVWTCPRLREPVAAAGMKSARPGVYSAWMFATPHVRRSIPEITRRCLTAIEAALANGAHRIECASDASHDHAHRWLGALGFEVEAVLERYGCDERDFLLFRRLG